MAKKKYGIHSIKLLMFLWNNPGASSGEIHKYLHDGKQVELCKITYRTKYSGSQMTQYVNKSSTHWYTDDSYYEDMHVSEPKMIFAYKIKRGKFSYLTSPHYSRSLAGNRLGSIPHARCAHKSTNRGWFYREKDENGRFKYYITTRGYAYLFGKAIPLNLLDKHNSENSMQSA